MRSGVFKKPRSLAATTERMEMYRLAHPGSPSAVRRPRLYFRSGVWFAVLGHDSPDGVCGTGPNVEAAQSAFDAEYLKFLHPAVETKSTVG